MRRLASLAAGFRALCIALLAGFGNPYAFSDSAAPVSPDPLPRLKTILVRSDDPSTWPKGLAPVTASELSRLLTGSESSASAFSSARIDQALFEATFRGPQRIEGHASFSIQNGEDKPSVILLGETNLQIDDLKWMAESPTNATNRVEDAIEGTGPDGQRAIVARRDRNHLEADWSVAGRKVSDAAEFSIVFPPAVVTQLRVRLPSEFVLEANTGVVSRTGEASQGALPLWQVDLGSYSSCRLRIAPRPLSGRKPDVFVDQETIYRVATDKLQVQAKLQLDVFSSPLRRFSLSIPPALRVEAVRYTDNVALAFERHPDRIDVTLPESLLGKGRPIVVEASAVSQLNRPWNLPRIDAIDAVRRTGQILLTVVPPLKLRRFPDERAIAQLEAPSYAADGEESFVLRDFLDQQSLTVDVGDVVPVLTGQILSAVDFRGNKCVLAGDVFCSASEGSTFAIGFDLPAIWELTSVQSATDFSGAIRWTVSPAIKDRKRVKIDFFRAVTDREPKRFRFEAQRPMPGTGETLEIPIADFGVFQTINMLTLVKQASPVVMSFESPAEFTAWDASAIPGQLVDSPLRPPAHPSKEDRWLVHRSTRYGKKAHLTVRRGLQGFTGRVRATVDVGTSQMTERVAISVTPEAAPLDRVLVYLTSEGPPLLWQLVGGRSNSVDVSRISFVKHAEWNLPADGELWEVRLPEPQKAEFRLEGTRKTSSLGPGRIDLAFLPGARSFGGSVEVRLEHPSQFDIEAIGPHPMTVNQSSSRASEVEVPGKVVKKWSYDQPTDALKVKEHPIEQHQALPQFATLELDSFLNLGGISDDAHKAKYWIAPAVEAKPFHFDLDRSARLISIMVNGRNVRPQRHEENITVPSLPADRWNVVEIAYRTASSRRFFREVREVAAPRAHAQIVRFDWRFALPPGVQLSGPPAGMALKEASPRILWLERLFGPLGRSHWWSSAQELLKPASWISGLGVSSDRSDAAAAPNSGADLSFSGWTVWHAWNAETPRRLRIVMWHQQELGTLSWIVVFGSLILGIIGWQLFPRYLPRVTILVLAVLITSTLLLPAAGAILFGGGISGLLLAALLSCPCWVVTRGLRPASPALSRSTVNFEHGAVIAILIGVTLLGSVAIAGDTPVPARDRGPTKETAQPTAAAAERNSSGSDMLVVIPVDRGGQPDPSVSQQRPDDQLVYVPADRLESLRARRSNRERTNYLWVSAHYKIVLSDRTPARIEAWYKVVALSDNAVEVRLPLSNVALAGVEACRVNGQPCRLSKIDDAFMLVLDPRNDPISFSSDQTAEPAAIRSPVSAPRPSRRGSSAQVDLAGTSVQTGRLNRRPKIFDIVLNLFPVDNDGEDAHGFRIGIPKVTRSIVHISVGEALQPVTVGRDAGHMELVNAGSAWTAAIGATGSLHIGWGKHPAAVVTPLEARAAQLIRVGPNVAEVHCRVTYSGGDRDIEDIEWRIPQGAAVRSTGEHYRIAVGSAVTGERLVPLKFGFGAGQRPPLTLTATLMIPLNGPHSVLTLPLVKFHSKTEKSPGVNLVASQVGVMTVPGNRLTVSTKEANLVRGSAADPAFYRELTGPGGNLPEFIYDARDLDSLTVELIRNAPLRKAHISHEARVLADQLQWKTTVEIRTDNASTFVHVLRVDPRLKIDSLSIRGDGVERLVRFSQNGDEVTLFMRDRASSTQDLVLRGSMPLELGREFRLPNVSLTDATATDVRLNIETDPTLEIATTNLDKSVRPSSTPAGLFPKVGAFDSREYVLPAGASLPSILVSRRPPRPEIAAPAPTDRQASPQPLEFDSEQQVASPVFVDLELQNGRPMLGSTRLVRVSGKGNDSVLKLVWPKSVVVRVVSVDDRPIPPRFDQDGQLVIPITSQKSPHPVAKHQVVVQWATDRSFSLALFYRLTQDIPLPLRTKTILLSIRGPNDYRLMPPASLDEMNADAFRNEFSEVFARAPRENDVPELTRSDVLRSGSQTGRQWLGRLIVGSGPLALRIVAYHESLLIVPLGCALFALILLVLSRRGFLAGLGWIGRRRWLLVSLVGIFWWIVLSPPVVGVALLAVTLGCSIYARLGPKPRSV